MIQKSSENVLIGHFIFIDHYTQPLLDVGFGVLRNIRIDIAKDFEHGEKNETVMKPGLAILAV